MATISTTTVFLMLALIVLGEKIIYGTKKLLSVLDLCFSHVENG